MIKIPKFSTKNALFVYFWAWIWKQLLSYLQSAPSNLSYCKVGCKKIKILKFGTKNPSFGCFRLEFENNIVVFKISHPQICIVAKFCEYIENIVIFEISVLKLVLLQSLVQKYFDLGIFGVEFENNIVIFEISILEFAQLQNFVKKTKILDQKSLIWMFSG